MGLIREMIRRWFEYERLRTALDKVLYICISEDFEIDDMLEQVPEICEHALLGENNEINSSKLQAHRAR